MQAAAADERLRKGQRRRDVMAEMKWNSAVIRESVCYCRDPYEDTYSTRETALTRSGVQRASGEYPR